MLLQPIAECCFVSCCPPTLPLPTHSPRVRRSDPAADVAAFKQGGGNVLVGTPGRLDDVLKRLGPAAELKHLEVLVRRGGQRGGGTR